MLGQRIVTAVVLLAILVGTLMAASPLPFAALVLALAAAGAWEWARMNGASPAMAVGHGVVVVAVGAMAGLMGWWPADLPAWFWPAVTLGWMVLLVLSLRAGVDGWRRLPALGRAEAGVVLMLLTAMAVLALRERGVAFLLSVCCIVWVCDTGAYFTGRLMGRTKLAPTVSPGKTREGLAGGVLTAMALGVVWWQLAPEPQSSFFAAMGERRGLAGVVIWTGLLAALSALGDLFESLVKRAAGVKDSSQLLPGHGGVLDRMDALLPVLPAAMALLTWVVV
ncbi:MAG: phosphatidate cytidylyltransferase [Proteobacteria bacterium]|nr:phosphatidate cytidylyltransferase [Pseudomonadota bacterium]